MNAAVEGWDICAEDATGVNTGAAVMERGKSKSAVRMRELNAPAMTVDGTGEKRGGVKDGTI